MRYSAPLAPRIAGGCGATEPDALPNEASSPRGCRQSREASQVSLPTPSNTTGTPLPLVILFTSSTTFCFV